MRSISLCLVVPLVLACGIVEPDSLTVRVEGKVTAADDGTPVAGATLGVFGFGAYPGGGTTTDASGDYSLSFVVPSCGEPPWGIVIRAPRGFRDRIFSDRIVEMRCTDALQVINVRLNSG